jgi:hypothetical protein
LVFLFLIKDSIQGVVSPLCPITEQFFYTTIVHYLPFGLYQKNSNRQAALIVSATNLSIYRPE